MNWTVAARIGSIALGALNVGIIALANAGAEAFGLDKVLFNWLTLVAGAIISFLIASMPSLTGLSSLKPERETEVVRGAVRNVAPLHPSAASGAPLPISDPAPPAPAPRPRE